MNLTIDIGNTHTKMALFDGDKIIGCWKDSWDKEHYAAQVEQVAVCATGKMPPLSDLIPKGVAVCQVSSSVNLPITLDYDTPETLGADRIAAAAAAAGLFRGHGCVIIDVGTCVTVDFLDSHSVYHGGAIIPGVAMQLEALHTFTEKLPLINLSSYSRATSVCGQSTRESILAGVMDGIIFSLQGFVSHYFERGLADCVVCTGGGAHYLSLPESWKNEPDLVMIGMNEILNKVNNS